MREKSYSILYLDVSNVDRFLELNEGTRLLNQEKTIIN